MDYGGTLETDDVPRKPRKGTKRYRKEQARMKKRERKESIVRVYALLDELAAIRHG